MNKLKQSLHAKIINISSVLYIAGKIHFDDINLKNKKYTPVKAYCQSKLAQVLFTRELAERLGPNSTIRVYCLHPGLIRTNLFRNFSPVYKFFNSISKKMYSKPKVGAQTTLFCVLEEELENPALSGHYFRWISMYEYKPVITKFENFQTWNFKLLRPWWCLALSRLLNCLIWIFSFYYLATVEKVICWCPKPVIGTVAEDCGTWAVTWLVCHTTSLELTNNSRFVYLLFLIDNSY